MNYDNAWTSDHHRRLNLSGGFTRYVEDTSSGLGYPLGNGRTASPSLGLMYPHSTSRRSWPFPLYGLSVLWFHCRT
jgi:hypothetical protein